MRYLAIALVSLGLAGLPSESRAQYPLGYYSNGYVVNPYVPAYRGYRFFYYEEELVIVDPVTLEIVAVIPA